MNTQNKKRGKPRQDKAVRVVMAFSMRPETLRWITREAKHRRISRGLLIDHIVNDIRDPDNEDFLK